MSKAIVISLSAMAAVGHVINAVRPFGDFIDLLFALGFTALTAWSAVAWREKA